MSDPCISPRSDVTDAQSKPIVSWWIPVLSVGLTLISGLIYAAIYPVVPQFVRLFEDFGADLPFATRFVVDTYKFYGLFFLVGLIPCLKLFRNRKIHVGNEKKLFVIIVLNFVLAFVVIGLVMVTLYLPIFQLGAAI